MSHRGRLLTVVCRMSLAEWNDTQGFAQAQGFSAVMCCYNEIELFANLTPNDYCTPSSSTHSFDYIHIEILFKYCVLKFARNLL